MASQCRASLRIICIRAGVGPEVDELYKALLHPPRTHETLPAVELRVEPIQFYSVDAEASQPRAGQSGPAG